MENVLRLLSFEVESHETDGKNWGFGSSEMVLFC